jgi:integrase
MSRFISRNLKRITSGGKKVRDVSDGRVPGLTLVVQKSGVQSWTLRYRYGEHQRRYTIGRTTEVSAVQARKIAQSMLAKVAEGIDPQADKAAERKATQTGQLAGGFVDQAQRFVEMYARGRNKIWLDQARHLGLSLTNRAARKDPTAQCEWAVISGSPCDLWRKRTVKSIKREEIAEVLDAVTAASGRVAANRTHATLSKFFKWSTGRGLDVSPMTGLTRPNKETSRDRVLTPTELSTIWWAAEKLRPPFGAFVRLLILTAARRNEAAGMTRAELVHTSWTIPAGRSKNGAPNTLPLPRQALEIIAELPVSGLLFTTTGRTPVSGFSKMKRVLDELIVETINASRVKTLDEVPPWTLHDLRRSAATGMASLGIEPHVVEAILGHRAGVISGVAAIYNRHLYADEKKGALQRWADAVEGYALLG